MDHSPSRQLEASDGSFQEDRRGARFQSNVWANLNTRRPEPDRRDGRGARGGSVLRPAVRSEALAEGTFSHLRPPPGTITVLPSRTRTTDSLPIATRCGPPPRVRPQRYGS